MYITNIFSKDTYQISIFDWYYNIDKCRIGSIITYLMLCIAAMPLHIYKFSIGLNFKVSIIHLWSHGLGQVAPGRLVSKLMIVLLWVFESWLECMKTCQKKNLSIFYFFCSVFGYGPTHARVANKAHNRQVDSTRMDPKQAVAPCWCDGCHLGI